MSTRLYDTASILPSAARTTLQATGDMDTGGSQFLNVVVDITAYTSGNITVTIQGKDTASGKYYTLLTSAALGAAATTRLKVGPTITAAANTIAQDYLPAFVRISVAVADATSITYSIGCSFTG